MSAKFWLRPVSLARNLGFSALELRRIQRLIEANEEEFLEKWHESFGN
jgi:3-methyladenine DNA glycosylase AlkD